ncbi:hypothetical protein MEBOL_006549 [Melittangium boletus DSM 14713]|uniref:HTH marR-type domain-containing protein n=2 Tax=Melittangium boletus TaxID=83453 RepID=A0A250IP82_9BACT|nr:hypothetical protein MEBOL_006549 [Melittangium boletus DSM 14713]
MNRQLNAQTRRPIHHLVALKVIALGEVRSQVELAERLSIDAPAASRLVDRLVEDGLVTRSAGENRRCVKLQVTHSVWPEVEILGEAARRVDAEVGRHLSAEEMGELRRLLDKLLASLAQNTVVPEKHAESER